MLIKKQWEKQSKTKQNKSKTKQKQNMVYGFV